MDDKKNSRSDESQLQIPPHGQEHCTARHDQHTDGIADCEDHGHPGSMLLGDVLSH